MVWHNVQSSPINSSCGFKPGPFRKRKEIRLRPRDQVSGIQYCRLKARGSRLILCVIIVLTVSHEQAGVGSNAGGRAR